MQACRAYLHPNGIPIVKRLRYTSTGEFLALCEMDADCTAGVNDAEIGDDYNQHKLGIAASIVSTAPDDYMDRVTTSFAANERLLSDPHVFAALVSHELREPINAIQSFLNVVIHERAGPLNELQSEFLRTAEISARRLARRIDDVQVALSGGEALQLKFTEFDPNEQVAQCCRELAWAAERYSVTLEPQLERSGEGAVCRGDPDRIDQILLNLIENAIQYARAGSAVRIISRRFDDRHWEIVAENMSDVPLTEDVSKWFEPYQRAGQAQGLKRPGFGLGLSIAKYLVDAHDGEIWASSSSGLVRVGFRIPCGPNQTSGQDFS